jgi:DNA adenine methylase
VCEPLLKWAGGKRRLLPHILPLVPRVEGRYYEPFFGGGALFFSLKPKSALLSDSNPELINAYLQVRDNLDAVVKRLREMPNTEEDYYGIRSSAPRTLAGRAARLIYLCSLSFNGIYRQNLDGEFNVPYGGKRHVNPCNLAKLQQTSKNLKGRDLRPIDFELAVRRAKRSDLVFFDPPYTVAHGNNGFIKYNAKIFSWADQVRLADVALKLKRIGVHVIVSNADHPSIRDLYGDFEVKMVDRYSVMSASSDFRRPVRECIFF